MASPRSAQQGVASGFFLRRDLAAGLPNGGFGDRVRQPGGYPMTATVGYHAHVYFNSANRSVAERLRDAIVSRFAVEPGAFSDEPRGPHPISQFNVMFQAEAFQHIVPWLMFNREGLDILVHPLTDDMVDDHTVYALWLGTPVKLNLETMRREGYPADLLPAASHPI
jgi:aromatic ring-cleaving dioxygenase